MKKNAVRFILTITFALVCSTNAFSQLTVAGTVFEVVDGKTLVIETVSRSKITVKLQFIEVPDPAEPFAEVIREHLQKLVAGKSIQFQTRRMSQFSMMTGVLLIGNVDTSQQMLRDGAAWYALTEKDDQSANERKLYLATEAMAKAEKRGLWSNENSKLARTTESEKPAKTKAENLVIKTAGQNP